MLGFLHDPNPQARQIALSNLLGHTPKDAPFRSIFFKGLQGGGFGKQPESEVVRDLKLLCRDQLVNLSLQFHDPIDSHSEIFDPGNRPRCLQRTGQLIGLAGYDFGTVGYQFSPISRVLYSCLSHFIVFAERLIIVSQDPQAAHADLAAMLLSNLSTSASVISILLSMKIPIITDRKDSRVFYPTKSRSGTSPFPPSGDSRDISAMPLLVDAFVRSALVDETQKLGEINRKGELHFLANVFANVTAVGFSNYWVLQAYR